MARPRDGPPKSAPPKRDTQDLLSRGYEPVSRLDWFMVVLGTGNVLMLIARDAYASVLPNDVQRLIVAIDLAIVGLFAVEFLLDLRRAEKKFLFVVTHWYDVVGLIPLSNWWLRSFRLVRVLRMYVVKNFPLETDPHNTWIQAFARGVIGHYKDVLLEEITDPIILASLDSIQPPLERARFAATLGNTLETHRDRLRYVVEEAVSNARGIGPLVALPKGREIVGSITNSALDAIIETLKSDEINEVLSQAIHDVFEEVRARVAEHEYDIRGTGKPSAPARGASAG